MGSTEEGRYRGRWLFHFLRHRTSFLVRVILLGLDLDTLSNPVTRCHSYKTGLVVASTRPSSLVIRDARFRQPDHSVTAILSHGFERMAGSRSSPGITLLQSGLDHSAEHYLVTGELPQDEYSQQVRSYGDSDRELLLRQAPMHARVAMGKEKGKGNPKTALAIWGYQAPSSLVLTYNRNRSKTR